MCIFNNWKPMDKISCTFARPDSLYISTIYISMSPPSPPPYENLWQMSTLTMSGKADLLEVVYREIKIIVILEWSQSRNIDVLVICYLWCRLVPVTKNEGRKNGQRCFIFLRVIGGNLNWTPGPYFFIVPEWGQKWGKLMGKERSIIYPCSVGFKPPSTIQPTWPLFFRTNW